MEKKGRPDFWFDVLLAPNEPEGGWAAHCLQLDLVEVGPTPDDARASMRAVIRAHVGYALAADNLEYMFRPAPAGVWRAFSDAELVGVERFDLDDDTGERHVLLQASTVFQAIAA